MLDRARCCHAIGDRAHSAAAFNASAMSSCPCRLPAIYAVPTSVPSLKRNAAGPGGDTRLLASRPNCANAVGCRAAVVHAACSGRRFMRSRCGAWNSCSSDGGGGSGGGTGASLPSGSELPWPKAATPTARPAGATAARTATGQWCCMPVAANCCRGAAGKQHCEAGEASGQRGAAPAAAGQASSQGGGSKAAEESAAGRA